MRVVGLEILISIFAFSLSILLSGNAPLQAQVGVAMGDGDDRHFTNQAWYWDTLAHQVWRHRADSSWFLQTGKHLVTEIDSCQGNMVFRTPQKILFYQSRHGVMFELNGFYCGESIRIMRSSYQVQVWSLDDMLLSHIGDLANCPIQEFEVPQIINNEIAFCLPRNGGLIPRYADCRYVNNWGLLSSRGEWIIEPKYDAPFRFQDGFAEVVYYGVRHKIDTLGKMIE